MASGSSSQPNSRSTSGASDAKFNKILEDCETSSKAALANTLSRLKKHVGAERQAYVKAKMDVNSQRLQMFCTHLLALSSSRASRSSILVEKDMLNTRIQKALNKLGTDASLDQQGGLQDDPSAPILFNASGGKSIVKPVKLQVVQRTPPYTTWIFLDRNQRMAEDQSVVGRRRIYYDTAGNEALICSDSEDEQIDEEEEKRDFSKGDDFIIRSTVREHGLNKGVFKSLADSLDARIRGASLNCGRCWQGSRCDGNHLQSKAAISWVVKGVTASPSSMPATSSGHVKCDHSQSLLHHFGGASSGGWQQVCADYSWGLAVVGHTLSSVTVVAALIKDSRDFQRPGITFGWCWVCIMLLRRTRRSSKAKGPPSMLRVRRSWSFTKQEKQEKQVKEMSKKKAGSAYKAKEDDAEEEPKEESEEKYCELQEEQAAKAKA